MSTRTNSSPSVQIIERDLSLIAPQNIGTNVFIAGFASQGYSDEVLNISSLDELKAIYGTPTNSAEKYFYYGVKELLNSPAKIYTYRLPYGSGTGDGFGSQYSALAYPVYAYNAATSATATSLYSLSAGTYVLGAPAHIILTENEYNQAQEGSLFTWDSLALSGAKSTTDGLSSAAALGSAGLIILNKSQTTINTQFEGYYVGLGDNTNINPSTDHNSIIGVQTVSTSASVVGTNGYTNIPFGTLQFNLSSTAGSNTSVSQLMESLTDYNIDGRDDDDLLNVGVFKLRKSLYATDAFKLDYVLDGAITGSIDTYRQRLNPTGGPQTSQFLENLDTNDRNITIMVNPYISNKYGNTSLGIDGLPLKKIRVLTHSLLNVANTPALSSKVGVPYAALSALPTTLGYADSLYAVGAYSNSQVLTKDLGTIPSKIERALESVKNDEIYDIDVVVEAGLGTIYTISKALSTSYYDDSVYTPTLSAQLQLLRTSNELTPAGADIRSNYETIFGTFENFCNLPSNTGGRGDCIFIADILRQIVITGKNTKILSDRSKNFQTDVYWAIRHQFELANTSYAAVYANWGKVYDEFSGDNIWVPFSSVAGATYARNDAMEFPWSAPAGYTRGLVGGMTIDIAITPNQKQRDELYKSNLNPVLFSPSQGMAIFGQKTLSRKPSAFDRVNVRRLFLALERPTKKASVFFVFEPNTEFTRTRMLHTLTPLFEYAKQNSGIYDYYLVCDERNNTSEVIDSNELKFDAYVKPVRTCEFITLTFTATRSDANFQEIL